MGMTAYYNFVADPSSRVGREGGCTSNPLWQPRPLRLESTQYLRLKDTEKHNLYMYV